MSSNNAILLKLTNQFEEAIYEVLKNRNVLLDLERRLVDVEELNPYIDESSSGDPEVQSTVPPSSGQATVQSTVPSSSGQATVQSTVPSSSGQATVQSTVPSSSGQSQGNDDFDIKNEEKQKNIVMGVVKNSNNINGLILQL